MCLISRMALVSWSWNIAASRGPMNPIAFALQPVQVIALVANPAEMGFSMPRRSATAISMAPARLLDQAPPARWHPLRQVLHGVDDDLQGRGKDIVDDPLQ